MFLSLLVGGLSSFALAGQTSLYDGHMMLSAHVTGLLGAALMFGLASTVSSLRYSAASTRRLCLAFGVSNHANLCIGTLKSFLFVHGIAAGGGVANNVVFVALTVTVVAPSLLCALLWAIGFAKADPADAR